MDTSEPVGFIGLGIMGSLLARRLLDQGRRLVVYNRTAEKARPWADLGATVAATPLQAAQACPQIFTVLTGPQALREVLFGAGGLCTVRHAQPRIVCDLSTQDPQVLQQAAHAAAEVGVTLVESPMAGSVHDATHGTLQFLQGGDRAALEALAPCFAAWGPAPIHFGPLGSATTAKLALNLLVGLMAEGFSEALDLLRRAGLSEAGFAAVLERSGLRSPLYQRLWQRYSARDREVRFSLDLLRKDILLCQSHAAWDGDPPALLRSLATLLGDLSPELRQRDYSALVGKA